MPSGKRSPHGDLSPSHEHYLRAIWEARTRTGYARVSDVARELGVSHASVSVGLSGLEQRGYVGHDPHRFLLLTAKGERAAREVHHRYRVVKRFLAEVLGAEAEAADREACVLEHHISPHTTERLVDLLKLLNEDEHVRRILRDRFSAYHRSCLPSEACSTCGLACLTPIA